MHTVARKSLAREHRARSSCDHVPVIAKNIYILLATIYRINSPHTLITKDKLCLLRGGQLYPCGNFVMGGYAAHISEMFELLHPYHTSTHHKTFSLHSPSP